MEELDEDFWLEVWVGEVGWKLWLEIVVGSFGWKIWLEVFGWKVVDGGSCTEILFGGSVGRFDWKVWLEVVVGNVGGIGEVGWKCKF